MRTKPHCKTCPVCKAGTSEDKVRSCCLHLWAGYAGAALSADSSTLCRSHRYTGGVEIQSIRARLGRRVKPGKKPSLMCLKGRQAIEHQPSTYVPYAASPARRRAGLPASMLCCGSTITCTSWRRLCQAADDGLMGAHGHAILQEGALVVADPMLHGHGALHSFSMLFGLHTSSRKTLTSAGSHMLHVPTSCTA